MNRRFSFLGIALLSILMQVIPPGPAKAEPFTPQQIARVRTVTSAVISPDASHIAYVLSVPRAPLKVGDDSATGGSADGGKYEDGPNWAELHVIRTADGVSRPFVVGEVNVEHVEWTADSKSISFLAKRGKDKSTSLYVIPVDGGEARQVLSHKTDITGYSWSPDGMRVAFLATEETPKKKKDLKDKGFTAEVYEEDLSNVRVWVAEIGEIAAKTKLLHLPGSASALKWSPAGNQLALALAPTPLVDDEYMKRKVHVVNVDGAPGGAGVSSAVRARFDNPGKLGALAWAPDGKHIAMLSAADLNDPADDRLMIGNVATGDLQDVLPNYDGAVSAVAWQDADMIMFIGDEGCETTFGKVDVTGTNRKTILPTGGQILTDFTLSRDGQHGAFVANTAQHPSEVFSMNHGDAAPKRLTDSNPWLAKMDSAKQEIVRYMARDRLDIEGILMHPLDERPRMLYPLILCVHGGPESHEHNGWLTNYSRPGQAASSGGYFTFYPNYRGSTGRGVAFSKLGQADEGGKEFDDLVDAVEQLASTYPIDKTKVGVTGGSYGGYATAWCSTALTEHFAAGVMFVGISDVISKKGTTDIPNEDYLVHTRNRLWDDSATGGSAGGGKWQFYLERSPIFHVKKARTPLLIMGGKADTRVHPSQSIELYHFLKSIGQVPVRLVQYPGEGHGNRKAALKLDYNIRMMQWFDHYLKGPGGAPPPYEIEYGPSGDDKKDEGKK